MDDTEDSDEIKVEPGQMWVLRGRTCWRATHLESLSADAVMILRDRLGVTLGCWWVLNSDGKKVYIYERTLRNYYRLLQPVPESGIEGNHG
jgi:hypothetical protein